VQVATEYVTCPACGRLEKAERLLAEDSAPAVIEHATCVSRGRGRMIWTRGPVTLAIARSVRRRVAAALALLDAEIKAAE
jgi:hypothetical protein